MERCDLCGSERNKVFTFECSYGEFDVCWKCIEYAVIKVVRQRVNEEAGY